MPPDLQPTPRPPALAILARLAVGSERPRRVRLAAAVALAGTAVALRHWFWDTLGPGIPFITFYPAVMMAAVYGGGAAGVVATGLLTAAAFLVIPPGGEAPPILAVAIFNIAALAMSGVNALLHRTVRLLTAEIRERRRAETTLAANEARLHAALDHLGEAVLLAHPDGRILAANPAACRLFGRSEAEMLRLDRSALVDPTDTRLPALLAERTRSGRSHGTLRFRHADGAPFEAEISSMLFATGQDAPLLASIAIHDLTENQRAHRQLAQAAQEWQATFDATRDAVWLLDAQCRIVRANRAATELFTRPSEAMVGHHCWEIAHGSASPLPDCPLQRAARSGRRETVELPVGARWYEVIVDPILDPAGRFTGAVHTMSDITDRRQAEGRLRREQELSAQLIDAQLDTVVLFDPAARRAIRWNRRVRDLSGYTDDEIATLPTPDTYHDPAQLASVQGALAALATTGRCKVELDLITKDGRHLPFEFLATTLPGESGPLVLSVGRDLTERRALEQSLQRAESHYRLIAENTADIIWLFDIATLRFVYVSPAVHAMRGYTPEEACAQSLAATLSPESHRFVLANIRQRIAAFIAGDPAARVHTYEFGLRHRDGHIIPAEVVTSLLTDTAGRPDRIVGITRDLTERHAAAARQKDMIDRLEFALESAQAGFWEWHLPTNHNVWSPELWRLYGLEPGSCEPSYEAWRQVVVPEDRETAEHYVQAGAASGAELNFEFRIRDRTRTLRTLLSRGRPVRNAAGTVERYLGIVLDITERRLAEDELRHHAARMQCLLRIAEHRTESVQEFLDRALAEALTLTGSTLGYIYHYDEARQRFILNTWSKDVMKECRIANPETCYELDKTGIWGEAVRQRRPIVLNDFAAAHPLKKGYPAGHAHLERFLTVPVLDGERIVAVVGVANKPTDYGENDIGQLQLLMGSVWRSVDRRRTELALQESERFARSTIDALAAQLCVLDATGTIVTTNLAWRRFAEENPPHPRHADPGANYLSVCDAATGAERDDARSFAAGIRAVLAGTRESFELEYSCPSPAEQRWFLGRVTRFTDAGPARLVVVHEDITARKHAETRLLAIHADLEQLVRDRTAALAEANRLLDQTAHIARVGGWEIDRRTRALTWTGATRAIHEVDTDYQPAIEAVLDFYAPEARPRLGEAVQRALGEGEPFDLELEFVTARSRHLWVRAIGAAFWEEGVITKVGGTFQDITERRRAEDALRQQRDQLEHLLAERTAANERLRELDRLKSEFLSTMSHELRTPLNSIVGFTGILLKGLAGPLLAEQEKQLGFVQASARHLLALINDLLDLSRIESGRIELQQEQFDLAEVVAEVASFLLPVTVQKGIALHTTCDPARLPLVGDRRRSFQILLNLATNAVKFTERGEVAITAGRTDRQITVAVRDTGIGILPEQLPHLFEAFRQLDSSHRRHYEGTGLGLHLSRKLLGLLGGSITVESTAGLGSTFTFTLPLAPP